MGSRSSSFYKLILASYLVAAFFSNAIAQQKVDNQALTESLSLSLNPPSPAVLVLFPGSIIGVETPVAVRYAMFITIAAYQIYAACDPVALSFLGTKDTADPAKVCDPLSQLIVFYQLTYRLIRDEFPVEAAGLAQFLIPLGVNVLDETTDTSTPIGWANVNSVALREYFDNDGWNSLGDETKTYYKFPFQDTTDYQPQNNPLSSPKDLSNPLRWQPLPFTDFKGRFGHQIHVTPHIGSKVKPLVLSMEDYESRVAPSPYKSPNKSKEIDDDDEKTLRKRINELFAQTRRLNDERIALAYWWDNKFLSLGSMILFFAAELGLQNTTYGTIAPFGEMLAQHDAILVAWKEKRRHDLVRPTTMIRRLLSGQTVNAYRGIGVGNGMIAADEWEPLLQVQPHSEYPSGSAVLCMASIERLQIELEEIVGSNGTIPPFQLNAPPGLVPGSPVDQVITFRFETLEQAAASCGESRLYSGVHFEPSVIEGNKLGKGIGKAAYEHVKDLVEGRVPKNCLRCKGK